MRKRGSLIIFIIIISTVLICSFPRPKKNKSVCGLIGKIQLDLSNDWYRLEKDVYTREFYIDIINENSGKTKSIYADKDGFFYIMNLSPGVYIIKKTDFNFQTTDERYNIRPITFGDEGIKITIDDKSIYLVGSININAEFIEEKKIIRTEVNFDDNDIDEIKEFLNKKDKKGHWKDFILLNNNGLY